MNTIGRRWNALTPGYRVVLTVVAGLVALAVVISASLAMYAIARTNADYAEVFGDDSNPDRIDITAAINRADTSAQILVVTLSNIQALGALADEGGNYVSDMRILTTSTTNDAIELKKSQWPADVEQRFALYGTVTDYPFDRYSALMELRVVTPDGDIVPTSVTVYNNDAFVHVDAIEDPTLGPIEGTGIDVALQVKRSTPMVVFAVFIMVLMLGLALAAVTAAYFVLRWRKGLVFGACSMMAGILFALIPLRNAVPGSPPIGSVIDFAAFFIAEIIISISLISSVVFGYRIHMAKARVVHDGRAQQP
ncbi:DUF4436 family protein [Mycobacterium sp. 236(2023)]|uniref:DUF4436 family protein n=1 Tax=Mycobacterium sp. 236(2023) TaxID=3038163 RepID=UPI0024156F29|nr:DUF4436 family protein [Mycobacterium sp. 236(2023)]MDG4666124.1 DUF4436 family protein [Mycobacterium sp. 236(2023)]